MVNKKMKSSGKEIWKKKMMNFHSFVFHKRAINLMNAFSLMNRKKSCLQLLYRKYFDPFILDQYNSPCLDQFEIA